MIIELATSLTFLVTSIYGPATIDDVPIKTASKINQSRQEMVIAGPETLEDHIKNYFKDDPVLAEIAKCESTYKQFKRNGHVVIRGLVNSYDVGVMQINEKYHAERAERLGFNIYTLDGNMAYAKWLYDKEGVKPWMSSSKCWKKADNEVAINSGKNQN